MYKMEVNLNVQTIAASLITMFVTGRLIAPMEVMKCFVQMFAVSTPLSVIHIAGLEPAHVVQCTTSVSTLVDAFLTLRFVTVSATALMALMRQRLCVLIKDVTLS